uniref:WW domain-containing protein n=1 Tax=Guillardia theta TaxID=55529 RepID=A0A7S4NPF2_GUITH|mmetsp:Transcript_27075/g.88521  ORF Transcript_27075/g.88521 Transcript_27075/m.88521 type:complete len:658 (+) Transcript_27075:60-2033(+)
MSMEIVERVQKSNQELLSLISSIPRNRQGSEYARSQSRNMLHHESFDHKEREALERSKQTIADLQAEIFSLKNILRQQEARQEAESAQVAIKSEQCEAKEKQLSESQDEINKLKKSLKNAEEEVSTANSKIRILSHQLEALKKTKQSPEKDSNLSERCMEAEAKVNALIDEVEGSAAKQEKDARIIWRLARRCKDILHKTSAFSYDFSLSTIFDVWAQHMKVRNKVKFGKFRILNRFKFKVYFYVFQEWLRFTNVQKLSSTFETENDTASSPSKSLILSISNENYDEQNSPSLSHKGSDTSGRKLRIENSASTVNTLELLKGAYHTNRLTLTTPRGPGGQDNSNELIVQDKSMTSNDRSIHSKGDTSPGNTDEGPLDWIFKYLGEQESNNNTVNSLPGPSNGTSGKGSQSSSRFKKINSLETPAKAMIIPDHNVFIEAELGLHVHNLVGARESPRKNHLSLSSTQGTAAANQSQHLTVHELSADWEKRTFTARRSYPESKLTPRGEPQVQSAYVKSAHDLERLKLQPELIAQISFQNQLPRGWKKYYDEVNQMPYYYNEILKVTQWERPPATRGTPIEISPSLQDSADGSKEAEAENGTKRFDKNVYSPSQAQWARQQLGLVEVSPGDAYDANNGGSPRLTPRSPMRKANVLNRVNR